MCLLRKCKPIKAKVADAVSPAAPAPKISSRFSLKLSGFTVEEFPGEHEGINHDTLNLMVADETCPVNGPQKIIWLPAAAPRYERAIDVVATDEVTAGDLESR